MSAPIHHGVPSLPPTGLQTTVTMIDPPTPLPEFARAPTTTAPHQPLPVTQPVRVPYSSVATVTSAAPASATAAAPTATVTQSQSPQGSTVPSKQPLAPQPSRGLHKTKRTFKVIIVGDAGVGKTCLSFRFCCGRFPEHTEATIGVDFRERAVHIERELLRVQLWDTAGQERYRQSIVAHYYRNVSAVVFVYDVTCKKSFDSLKSWIAECERHGLGATTDVPRILIGNKCDLEASDRVCTDNAQIFADQHNMALFETSAKADSEADHVESIFMTLAHKLQQCKPMHVQSEKERSEKEQETLHLRAEEAARMRQEEEGWCC